MNIKFDKIDWVKVASTAGVVLSVGATVLSSWAGDKKTTQTIEEKVQEAINKLNK